MKTALITGSSGLVGNILLKLLLDSDRYDVVKAATRRGISISHPKLVVINVDFTKLESYKDQLQADDVFCCIGTTMAKAGSKKNFRAADYGIPIALARVCYALGAKQFLIVSALGADPRSPIYYNRVKGEMEHDLLKLGFPAIHIFRPTLLLGKRSEMRPAEQAAKVFFKIFWFLMPYKFQPIRAEKVARAMLYFAEREQHGSFIHEARQLQRIVK